MNIHKITVVPKLYSDDFYITPGIPKNKLENARNHYHIPKEEKVLGLIDGTVFGSAKNGVAFGCLGIYWKNDWMTETSRNFLSWDELIKGRNEISTDAYDVFLPKGCVIGLVGSSIKSAQLKTYILEIIQQITENSASETLDKDEKNSFEDQSGAENSQSIDSNTKESSSHNKSAREYDKDLLNLVNHIASRHRLARCIHIAPNIPTSKIRKVLEISKEEVDPLSIIVIIDNTIFGNCIDFLFITHSYMISKEITRDVDIFKIAYIRNISINNRKLYINNHDFQNFDTLTESESIILGDFLNELVFELKKYRKNISYYEELSKEENIFLNTVFKIAREKLYSAIFNKNTEEENEEDEEAAKFFLDTSLTINTDILVKSLTAMNYDEFCIDSMMMNKLVTVHPVLSGLAFTEIKSNIANDIFGIIYASASAAFISALIYVCESNGALFLAAEHIHLNMFWKSMHSKKNLDEFQRELSKYLEYNSKEEMINHIINSMQKIEMYISNLNTQIEPILNPVVNDGQ